METDAYARIALILLAIVVLSVLLYQVIGEHKRRTKLPIGFTARPFATLEPSLPKDY